MAEPFPTSLCVRCALVRRIQTERGSVFLQCGLARTDPRFRKYPPQPVHRCEGFREGGAG